MYTETFSIGKDRTRVLFQITWLKKGLVVIISGGISHIGTVVYGQPYLREKNKTFGCTISMINPPKHKEYIVATEMCRYIVEHLGIPAVITGGIHIENALPEEIEAIKDHCRAAAQKIVASTKSNRYNSSKNR